ncbi:MAG TPA: hypothetical protein VM513_10545 [Kofleriaceae bacterium]|nr:hypothetical protein [Kofleriaceae bacterium]
MRNVLPFVLSLFTACAATGPRPVNVASVRNEIDATIQAEHGDRSVTSMGKVTSDHAVVYTTFAAGGRQEETWIKVAGAWKLEKSEELVRN